MGLFSAIQQSSNALTVAQLGLQVVSNNVSNANTPGYIRQELVQAPGIGYRYGGIILGQGVEAVGVQQQIDYYTADRLRDTQSQLSYQQTLNDGLTQLQDTLSELGDSDISSALSAFSNSFQDIANNPQSASMKSLAVSRGVALTQALNQLSKSADGIADKATQQISSTADNINRLTASIAELNKRIMETEGGRVLNSDAVGLRDERLSRLTELADLVSIQATEQSNGSVSVTVGGDYLVADGLSRPVKVVVNDGNSDMPTEIRIAENEAPLNITGGKLKGYYEQRSAIVGDFKKQINDFTSSLINTVNKIHSQGQSSVGYQSVTGSTALTNTQGPLEQSGKNLIIENGSFNISVFNASTNTTRTFEIDVRQLGDGTDTTADNLVSQIDNVDGIKASIGNDGKLRIESDSPAITFSFSDDNTGTLAALGINTFFSGSTAADVQVKSEIQSDPRLLAISLDGPGNGARNALAISSAFTTPQASLNGLNIQESYENFVSGLAQKIDSQETVMKGVENFHSTLEAKHLSITGVSLDEEAAKLLMYQRAFQASSKVISTVNQLFDVLVSMV